MPKALANPLKEREVLTSPPGPVQRVMTRWRRVVDANPRPPFSRSQIIRQPNQPHEKAPSKKPRLHWLSAQDFPVHNCAENTEVCKQKFQKRDPIKSGRHYNFALLAGRCCDEVCVTQVFEQSSLATRPLAKDPNGLQRQQSQTSSRAAAELLH